MKKKSCDQPVFETTKFSEEVLNLKYLEHYLSLVKIGTVVFEIRAEI